MAEAQAGDEMNPTLLKAAVPTALCATLITFYSVYMHWTHYYSPINQRYIVRVLVMVPVFAITSVLALAFPPASHYLELLRDCYEAFTVFTFFSLLISLGGGERQVIHLLSEKAIVRQCCDCCNQFKTVSQPEKLFFRLKRYTLQFAIIMPLLALIVVILDILNIWTDDEDYSADMPYLWIDLARLICIIIAIWGLVNFYLALREELSPYNPAAKWICLKAVVFLSFVQGLALSLTFYFLDLDPGYSASQLQNTIICGELCLISLAHLKFYSWKEFDRGSEHPRLALNASVRDSLLPGDVINDTYSTFSKPYLPKMSDSDDLSRVEFGDLEEQDDFGGEIKHESNFPVTK